MYSAKLRGKQVAIKMYDTEDHESVNSFNNEINSLQRLSVNENIIRYLDNGKCMFNKKEVAYIVLELCLKQNLYHLISQERFSESAAKLVMKKILNGLKYLQS